MRNGMQWDATRERWVARSTEILACHGWEILQSKPAGEELQLEVRRVLGKNDVEYTLVYVPAEES